jgi:polysaccharide biosynthesis/export protein
MSTLKRLVLFSLLIGLCFSSCVPKRELVYLQSNEDNTDTTRSFKYSPPEYKLQINDIIDVQIRSSSPEANDLFNLAQIGSSQNQTSQAAQVGDIFYLTGYSIDNQGLIELPVLGSVSILGLTLKEAKTQIENLVDEYFEEYFLSVKLGGIRYSTIGEFKRPGKYTVLQNQLTIFEAIAQAGDLTIVASRADINLIRQYPNETRIHKINLLDESIIESPFYFIQPNDVIYVEPLKQKSAGLGITGAQTFTVILSAITTSVALILAIQALDN